MPSLLVVAFVFELGVLVDQRNVEITKIPVSFMLCFFNKPQIEYRTLAIITRGFYYFSIFSCVGFSLMFGGIPMKLGGYKTREVIIRARLMMASVRYVKSQDGYKLKNSISKKVLPIV